MRARTVSRVPLFNIPSSLCGHSNVDLELGYYLVCSLLLMVTHRHCTIVPGLFSLEGIGIEKEAFMNEHGGWALERRCLFILSPSLGEVPGNLGSDSRIYSRKISEILL